MNNENVSNVDPERAERENSTACNEGCCDAIATQHLLLMAVQLMGNVVYRCQQEAEPNQ